MRSYLVWLANGGSRARGATTTGAMPSLTFQGAADTKLPTEVEAVLDQRVPARVALSEDSRTLLRDIATRIGVSDVKAARTLVRIVVP